MKRVIFIGGCSYSGSTMLDLILSNDPRGFSCGEVHALFNPYRPFHFNPECGCGAKNCKIWPVLLKEGGNRLYENIFRLFPDIEFIVDSSKNPFWIKSQTRSLLGSKIEVKNLLIWKRPEEAAHSYIKRNRFKEWQRSWINYHRMYFTLIDDWKSISYSELIQDGTALQHVCDYLGIEYFELKREFWRKKHHILFGNLSARIHLSQNQHSLERAKNELMHEKTMVENELDDRIQSIYYEESPRDIVQLAGQRIASNKYFSLIDELISARDVCGKHCQTPSAGLESVLHYGRGSLLMKYLRNTMPSLKARITNSN